jgi:hypothetical protein
MHTLFLLIRPEINRFLFITISCGWGKGARDPLNRILEEDTEIALEQGKMYQNSNIILL